MGMQSDLSDNRAGFIAERLVSPGPQETIRQLFGYDGGFATFDHHMSHAESSFYCSGFDEATILTVDGVGEWATTTYGAEQVPALNSSNR
jgi:carbamoyltransferase